MFSWKIFLCVLGIAVVIIGIAMSYIWGIESIESKHLKSKDTDDADDYDDD